MCRITISGYYGFNNIGDEAILVSMINSLKKRIDKVQVTVLSANPHMTSEKHGVSAVDRKSLKGVLDAIKDCDLFISGGGSLLQDVTSRRSIIYYLVIMFMSLILRKKILIYSQGIGPISTTSNRIFTKFILNRVEAITVRDEKSKKELIDMGVSEPPIFVTADPVIGLDKVCLDFGEKIIKEEKRNNNKIIGFAMRGWRDNVEFNNKICKVADRIIKELGYEVAFIPFHYGEDIKIMDYIENNMEKDAIFIRKRYEIHEMLSIIGNFQLLVGVRLHSLIFAAVMNTPIIGISYDPKINSFMESINLDTCGTVKDLDEEALFLDIRSKLDNLDEEKSDLYNNVEKIKDDLKINDEVVQKLIKGEKI
ncbi:polysaccharide pyruvyl transferase CsaB [Anaeromicrobium sediminis]|uniref:Polysaccharide pyruvyl transferase CsaB n=1 Tax=Anaeromicrobium sediminis TaxID=1478221 RepID=A0A267MGQ7_9FIRM|nr:polysaccharide pyruvyl transferase CsaB [Anaeromicrobium sediminis]PAB58759.1 polysaccharide pyruvyl transferase CsaB [Anaeromicrobium sediminis]